MPTRSITRVDPAELMTRLGDVLNGRGVIIAVVPLPESADAAPPKRDSPPTTVDRAGLGSQVGQRPGAEVGDQAAAVDETVGAELDRADGGCRHGGGGLDSGGCLNGGFDIRADLDAMGDLDEGAVVVPTSGSTGRPRHVVLPARALRAAADAAHAWLGGPGTWTSALPTDHVAGLMTVVRALAAGRPWRAVAPDLGDLGRVVGPGPHYLSIVPTQLHRALTDPLVVAALAAYDAVLVGGARLDPSLRQAATARAIRVVRTYGMSETGGGVVYDGQPLPGVTVDLLPWPDPAVPGPADQLGTADQIHEAGASPAPSHATNSPHQPDLEAATALTRDQPNWGGRIALTTPTCFAGYLGDPIATAAVRHGQTFLSADRGTWANGRLVVTGRIDDVVQSGGVNVDLAELQGHLDAVFGTDQVVAFAIPDPRWGARIMAATVSRFTVVDVVDRLGARVAPAARPRSVLRLAALPLLASGKIDRRELTARWEELAHGDSR